MGLELIITNLDNYDQHFNENLHFPQTLFGGLYYSLHYFPHQGAFSMLNIHSTQNLDKYSCTSLSLFITLITFAAVLIVLLLSEMSLHGQPRCAAKVSRLLMKV